MKFTLKEMNGLLNGKCLPSDLIVGETLAEYLVRKFSALEQRLIESERYGRQTDITIDNLEMKLAQMAAENAGLKAICEDRRTFIMNGVQLGYIQVPTVETDPALETIRVAVSPQESTPSTDAFMAEVRAQGVDSLVERRLIAARLAKEAGHEITARDLEGEAIRARIFAMELRKGVQS
ncbi:TPA: hNH endonuclease [Enterobacter ludwigii]